MPRRSLEQQLTRVVDLVAPGTVTIQVPRHAGLKKIASYEVSLNTRRGGTGALGQTVAEAVSGALDLVEHPAADEVDPYIPSWYRVSRMQREIVLHTLRRLAARYTSRAAEAKLIHDERSAHGYFEIADAFRAADEVLDFDDMDADGNLLPQEPLTAAPPASTPTDATTARRSTSRATRAPIIAPQPTSRRER